MAFLLDFMRQNPRAVYADAHSAAKKAGHLVYPIMWGRAQVMLGRKKAKPRGTAKAAASARGGARGGSPARPARAAAGRRPRASAASPGGMVLPVSSSADLDNWQGMVSKLNQGGRVALQFDGSTWALVSG